MPALLDYLTFEEPYAPNMHHTPAIYRIDIGPFFYFGSGRRVGSRVSDHTLRLERGIHPNSRMQEAWNARGKITFTIIEYLEKKPGESKADLTERLRVREGWKLRDWFGDPRCLNLSSESGYNSGCSDTMKRKWADPEWRGRQREIMKKVWARPVSEETRDKMAMAKTGKANVKSKPCTLTFDGETKEYESVSLAAARFKVSPYTMELWLNETVPWPGTGVRVPRRTELVGLTGHFGHRSRSRR